MIDQNLINTYRQAKYIVMLDNQEYRLHVGGNSEFVDQLLLQQKVNAAYFITPENPFSCQLSTEENVVRHQRFCEEIDKERYFYLRGYGTDEAEQWQKEFSYLLFTDDEYSMQDLASRFEQNAFLKIPYKAPTQLFVLESQRYVQN